MRLIGIVTYVALLGVSARSGWSQGVTVQNPGFESSHEPAGWTADRPLTAAEGGYGIDRSVAHTGEQSLSLSLRRPGSLRLLSSGVKLEVGKIYRLSGWIRTEGASADPLSRYPTGLPATLSMASIPFTNTSMPVGGTRPWTKSEIV